MEGILFTDQYDSPWPSFITGPGRNDAPCNLITSSAAIPITIATRPVIVSTPASNGYSIWMKEARFRSEDIDYLRSQRDSMGKPLFADDFLGWLSTNGNFDGITMHAVPEGRVVHPNTPLTVVEGPLIMAQILETALLAILIIKF